MDNSTQSNVAPHWDYKTAKEMIDLMISELEDMRKSILYVPRTNPATDKDLHERTDEIINTGIALLNVIGCIPEDDASS
ncbi:hypothetical protein NIES267_55110 [Calothrix parasitica NIES-267]|uniref:Uncharacterized protein n=1 Tax=Calothrix parasitica NIES-267 TaxID=1973488 RepID=A0A1Z4LXM0_9CYAN|nr:hypothetical protein NIES267_55110 [Calothrix parasitica NIES-267]